MASRASLSEGATADALGPLLDAGEVAEGPDGLTACSSEVAPEPGPAARRSDTHAKLKAARRESLAADDPRVSELRATLLPGGLLDEAEVDGWLRERSGAGEPLRHWITYETPDRLRKVRSTPELEGLRSVSEDLAKRLNWRPDLAVVFILTGIFFEAEIGLSLSRGAYPLELPPQAVVTFDLDTDANEVAGFVREAQERFGISKRPKAADAERLKALGSFVAEHGTGEEAMVRWNREHSEWRYASRRGFGDAARKVRRPRSAFERLAAEHEIIQQGRPGSP